MTRAGERSSALATATRLGAAASSQLVYGLTNFVMLAVVASQGTDGEFGSVSLVYIHVLLWLAIARAASGDVLLIRQRQFREEPTGLIAGAVVVAAAISCLGAVGTLLLGATVLADGWAPALAAALPVVAIYDTARAASFAAGSPRAALTSDLVWLFVEGGVLAMSLLAGGPTVAWAIGAWSMGSFAALATSLVRWGRGARIDLVRFRHGSGGLVMGLVAGSTLLFASRNVTYYLIAWAGSIEELGEVRRALLPYGPLSAIFLGLGMALIPRLASSGAGMARLAARASSMLGALGMMWLVACLGFVHLDVPGIRRAIGTDEVLVLVLGIALVFQGAAVGGTAALRAMGRPAVQAWIMAVSLVCMATAVVALVPGLGARGGAVALALGNGVEGVGCVLAAQRLQARSVAVRAPEERR